MKLSAFALAFAALWSYAWMALPVQAETIPINAWIHDPVIDSVGVSPDGNQLVALTLADVNAPPQITVWQTEDLSVPPKRFAPVDIKAMGVFWLNDEYLLVFGRQKFDIRVGGIQDKWFRTKLYVVDDEGERFRELLENQDGGKSLFDVLPQQEDKFLVRHTNREFASDIYEVDLGTFISRRVYRSARGVGIFADHHGVIRGRQELEGGGDETRIEFSYKHPETGEWELHHELVAVEREGMQPVAFNEDGRRVYMVDNTGREQSVIRTYDLLTRELGEPIYGGDGIEAVTVLLASNPDDFGKVIGFRGYAEQPVREYTDPKWAAIQQRLDEALPADQQHRIWSMSDDLTIMVVRSSGPREAAAWNLLVNGEQLVPLGRSYPFLEPDKLADMEFVTYEARDGLEIPAFLTRPPEGNEPYPTVVMPHGGPWARDFLSWDRWAQFLANRGYAVLQPQYRGSDGWGQTLWRAGDKEWGQKMQDDKDDGALVARRTGHRGPGSHRHLRLFLWRLRGHGCQRAHRFTLSMRDCRRRAFGTAQFRQGDVREPVHSSVPESDHWRNVAAGSCRGRRNPHLCLPRREGSACTDRAVGEIRSGLAAGRQGREVPGDCRSLAQ